MGIRTSASNLAGAMKHLIIEWQHTTESWSDAQSRAFHDEYLGDLPQQVARATAIIEELDGVLRKIRADCE